MNAVRHGSCQTTLIVVRNHLARTKGLGLIRPPALLSIELLELSADLRALAADAAELFPLDPRSLAPAGAVPAQATTTRHHPRQL